MSYTTEIDRKEGTNNSSIADNVDKSKARTTTRQIWIAWKSTIES